MRIRVAGLPSYGLQSEFEKLVATRIFLTTNHTNVVLRTAQMGPLI